MSRQDAITNQKAMTGNSRSHAMNATKRKFNLNLQKVTIKEGNAKKTVKASAKTIRTLKKQGRLA